jgi:hypothetical protein
MLSGFVINELFTLGQSELQAVLSRYGVDMRLGAALQIGFLKMCGRPLDKFQRVPFAVLEHLNAQLEARQRSACFVATNIRAPPRHSAPHHQIATFCTECTGRPKRRA